MNIFVTGFHRAGSKTIAQYIAEKNNLQFVEEHSIDLWDFRRVVALTNGFMYDEKSKCLVDSPLTRRGFVLQCPFLTHRISDLAWYGRVYWAERNHVDIITSMKNYKFEKDALFIIKQFYDEFPDDPCWDKFFGDENMGKYFNAKVGDKFPQIETSEENWLNYYKLVVDIKNYFFKTKFKDKVEVVRLEDLPVYNKKKHLSGKKPLKGWELDAIQA